MGSLIQFQNVILQMIAKGDSLERTAERLCLEVENLAPGVICSVLTLDNAGSLRPLAALSLPEEYSEALDGLPIGPNVGSCGTAAYLRSDVVVTEIETDTRWGEFKHVAIPLGLRACWSSPILNAQGTPLGAFAFYYRECRGPNTQEQMIAQHCVALCVIAIERHDRISAHDRRAHTDGLTGLHNRAAFEAALGRLPCEVPGAWALLMVDLDNFKTVNDTFGHLAGDRLLQAASDRIGEAVSPDRLYRIGGDEFAIILQSPDGLRDIDGLADRLLNTLAVPINCGGHTLVPRATIGGAVLSVGEPAAERVRQNADFALYHAKESGRRGFVRYWPGIGTSMMRRLTAIRDVRAALNEGRIEAYYQPIVRLDTREVVGVEALCRMQIGDQIIPAAAFHEATEDVHVATELTARMMSRVAADVRAWLDMGIPFQHVGINVSSADMHGPVDQVLERAFGSLRVPLKHVILEVTESVYMGHGDRIVQKAVERLRAKGIRVALDDFGTGFASLTHLMTVPVDIIKIDKSFVGRLKLGDPSMAIVEGLIQIARKLDIHVVTEGIETEIQARHLQAFGCSLGQGYLFSRPLDHQAMTALLLKRAQPIEATRLVVGAPPTN